jgi:hypothetical protein
LRLVAVLYVGIPHRSEHRVTGADVSAVSRRKLGTGTSGQDCFGYDKLPWIMMVTVKKNCAESCNHHPRAPKGSARTIGVRHTNLPQPSATPNARL